MTFAPTACRSRRTKRILLFASAAVVVIFAGLLLWFVLNRNTPVPAGFPAELSREDFRQIQQATGRAMWRVANPFTSWQTLPRRLLLLATSNIRKVEMTRIESPLVPSQPNRFVMVETHSPYGDCTFLLAKGRNGKGAWASMAQFGGPGGVFQGYGGAGSSVKISYIGTSSNEVHGLVTLPKYPHFNSLATNQPPVLSEPDFAASLSNRSSIMLAH